MRCFKLMIVAMIFPAALFAGVSIQVKATIPTGDERVAIDEPWFEDRDCEGDAEVSYEYQWTSCHGERALTFRKVMFTPFTGAWVFGPWIIHEGRYVPHNRHNNIIRVFSHYDVCHRPVYEYRHSGTWRPHRSTHIVERDVYHGHDHGFRGEEHRRWNDDRDDRGRRDDRHDDHGHR